MLKQSLGRAFRFILFGAVLLALISLITAYTMPKVSRCFWIGLNNDFIRVNDIYVSKDTPPRLQTRLLADIERARMRNQQFWPSLTSTPQIIYCHQPWQYNRLGIRDKPATSLLTFIGAYVVLAPTGNKLDIISHELCHAELLDQVGWFARDQRIPTWFDEGLAMQMDHRSYYSEGKLAYFGASLIQQTDITALKSPTLFFTEEKHQTRLNYILAKQKVKNWLGEQPKKQISAFCNMMRNGKEFEEAFGQD